MGWAAPRLRYPALAPRTIPRCPPPRPLRGVYDKDSVLQWQRYHCRNWSRPQVLHPLYDLYTACQRCSCAIAELHSDGKEVVQQYKSGVTILSTRLRASPTTLPTPSANRRTQRTSADTTRDGEAHPLVYVVPGMAAQLQKWIHDERSFG